jgi:aminoglycoside/choline kinase family phosphotransferase
MTGYHQDIDPGYLTGIIEKVENSSIEKSGIVPLPGDASDRRYSRVSYTTKKGERKTVVLMQLGEPGLSGELPFLNVQKYLKKKKIPVPEVFFYDREKGLVVLEDLGEMTMEERLKKENNRVRREFYQRAIDILLNMQKESDKEERGACIAYSLEFDVEKLMGELDFFVTHMIEGLLQKKIRKADRKKLEESFLAVVVPLTEGKKVFTHRDYHSRNIMIRNDTLGIVDFQDARLGLCQYDLASLLRDSYLVLDEELKEDLIDYYITGKEALERTKIDRKKFMKLFDYMSLQRNLKAVGTFSYQSVCKKNARYLEYIEDTLGYVRTNLGKYAELRGLKDLLFSYLE